MPRLSKALPKYRKHRASGQAIVSLCSKDFYLGPHGTKTSKQEYDRLIGEWLANGRRMPIDTEAAPITIIQLIRKHMPDARIVGVFWARTIWIE